jgi:hypothetical protein
MARSTRGANIMRGRNVIRDEARDNHWFLLVAGHCEGRNRWNA